MAMYPCLSLPSLSFPSVSGAVCSFDSQYAGLPLKAHSVAVTGYQSGSGTPSPQNIRSINGHSALNISRVANNNLTPSDFVISTSGRTMTYSNEAYSIVPTINTQSSFILTNAILDYMNVIEAGTYKIDVVFTDDNYSISGVYADLLQSDNTVKQVINGETFTVSNSFRMQDLRAALFDFVNGVNLNFKIFITKLSDLQYVSINLGGTYYGGEYDARTGVFVATHILFTITNVDSVGTQGGRYFFRKGIPASSHSISMTPTNLDNYMSETYYPALDHSAVGTFFVTSSGTSLHLTPTDQTLDTVAKMNTYLADNPAVCVIPLEESLRQTIQLPPCPIDTLLGVNNVFADTGDTTLQYAKFG